MKRKNVRRFGLFCAVLFSYLMLFVPCSSTAEDLVKAAYDAKVHTKPDKESETVFTVEVGEVLTVLQRQKKNGEEWLRVRSNEKKKEGWLLGKQVKPKDAPDTKPKPKTPSDQSRQPKGHVSSRRVSTKSSKPEKKKVPPEIQKLSESFTMTEPPPVEPIRFQIDEYGLPIRYVVRVKKASVYSTSGSVHVIDFLEALDICYLIIGLWTKMIHKAVERWNKGVVAPHERLYFIRSLMSKILSEVQNATTPNGEYNISHSATATV